MLPQHMCVLVEKSTRQQQQAVAHNSNYSRTSLNRTYVSQVKNATSSSNFKLGKNILLGFNVVQLYFILLVALSRQSLETTPNKMYILQYKSLFLRTPIHY